MATRDSLTAERLREVLHYDPVTGVFTRLVRTSNRVNVGDVAGSPDARGYLRIRVEGKQYFCQRLAFLYMTGAWPKFNADHKNGVLTDNAYYNGALIDEAEKIVKFSGYGSGSAFYAMRSLLLGAHAVAVAYGTRGQTRGTRYELGDSDLDHGEESVVTMRLIAGYRKSRYNGMDFGVVSVDHAYTKAAGETF